MKLIEPKVELIQQAPGLIGMYKHIERCARTCYKSEDTITDNSYEKLCDKLMKAKHFAMFEHGTVYLNIFPEDDFGEELIGVFIHNPYTKCIRIMNNSVGYAITTNFRVIVENNLDAAMKYICEPTEAHERRITFKFTTNIGVAREGNRHRVNSIAEESTRYCDYSKGNNNGEINITSSVWIDKDEREVLNNVPKEEWLNMIHSIADCEDKCILNDAKVYYGAAMVFSNICYNKLRTLGWAPQQAREVLPLATKSEVVYTAFASDWKHWFDLRLVGTTGKPHPNMEQIAELAQHELIKNNLWDLIYDPNKKEN